jgi:hypothetical protein
VKVCPEPVIELGESMDVVVEMEDYSKHVDAYADYYEAHKGEGCSKLQAYPVPYFAKSVTKTLTSDSDSGVVWNSRKVYSGKIKDYSREVLKTFFSANCVEFDGDVMVPSLPRGKFAGGDVEEFSSLDFVFNMHKSDYGWNAKLLEASTSETFIVEDYKYRLDVHTVDENCIEASKDYILKSEEGDEIKFKITRLPKK